MLSSFEVTPVAMPTLVAVDAALRDVGDEIAVTHNVPGSDAGQLAVVPEGGDPADPVETLEASGERGTTAVDTAGWEPGSYDVVLTGGDDAEIARVPFYLRDPRAELELSTDKRSLRARASRSKPRGRGGRRTAGTGSGCTRPRRRTPRTTTI